MKIKFLSRTGHTIPTIWQSFRKKLDRFIHHPVTDGVIIVLILISIADVIIANIIHEQHQLYHFLNILDLVLTSIFIVELSIRFIVANRKIVFFRRYWLDIIAVIPILRTFRILRVLRLLRIFRMGYLINRRLLRITNFFSEAYLEYYSITVVVIIILLAGSVSIFLLENGGDTHKQIFRDFADAFWWTLYTVISGEMGPAMPGTFAGKLVTILLMLSGLTLFAMFTGIVAAAMVQKLKLGMEDRMLEIEDLENHIVMCGWNRQGKSIVEEFQADKDDKKQPIVIIAELSAQPQFDPQIVNREMIYFISADYTNVDILRKANVKKADKAIILADKSKPRSDQDRDARTVLTALTIEKLNPKIFTCAELLNRDNEVHLHMAGVEEVIVGDEYVANVLAAASRNRGMMKVVNELFTAKYGNQFYKIKVPENFLATTFIDISSKMKRNYDAIILAIENNISEHKSEVIVNPPADYLVKPNDYLIIISQDRVVFH